MVNGNPMRAYAAHGHTVRTASAQLASTAATNFSARATNLPPGSRSPRSHRASVHCSAPIRRAASAWVSPRAVRQWTRRSAQPSDGGSGRGKISFRSRRCRLVSGRSATAPNPQKGAAGISSAIALSFAAPPLPARGSRRSLPRSERRSKRPTPRSERGRSTSRPRSSHAAPVKCAACEHAANAGAALSRRYRFGESRP